ncbi:chromosomal replication initiator protein DnaA [Pseudoxanthobacter soli DSM 19599]|uniref:Chromosomal replication initiator protein DnaA n=2 Tax=Pseudoxanthobacter TaxID=433838 RepID=A0A1M7ZBW7_9HYPH|nr:chromosomal replication initiator protein DnaA [Pseudoxanthobacter soli DSM 19599]
METTMSTAQQTASVATRIDSASADRTDSGWSRVRSRLKSEYGDDVFSSWFARVDLESCANGIVHLSVPTRFLKQWIQSYYGDRLMALWQEESPDVRRLDISVRSAARVRMVPEAQSTVANNSRAPESALRAAAPAARGDAAATPRVVSTPAAVTPLPQADSARSRSHRTASPAAGGQTTAKVHPFTAPRSSEGAEGGFVGSPLDPRFTLATFVEGRSNALALAAARQVAGARAGEVAAFNPLFIHAPVGYGKTHLLQAIAAEAGAGGHRRVLYLTAEHFVFRFVAALQAQAALAFKENLRGIDLLLIDDLQFLHGDRTQEEFCHILNVLIDGARQVVIAADRPPSELSTLDPRVRSRLGGGLTVEIGSPDADLRRAVVAQRFAIQAQTYPGLSVPEAVIDFVARAVVTNGRDLDGAVNRLVAHNQLTGAPITVEMAETALRDLVKAREARRVRIEDIQRVVSRHYNVSKADLISARRTQAIVRPRQIAMYLAKTMTPRSLPEIGRQFGGRDHTTVLHAVRKIEELSRTDARTGEEIEALKRLLDD